MSDKNEVIEILQEWMKENNCDGLVNLEYATDPSVGICSCGEHPKSGGKLMCCGATVSDCLAVSLKAYLDDAVEV